MKNKRSVVFIIKVYNKFLVGKSNKHHSYFYNKLHFPGGKIEDGETAVQAMIREAKEEVNIDVTEYTHLGESYTNKGTHLDWYLITDFNSCPTQTDSDLYDIKFITLEDVKATMPLLEPFIIKHLENIHDNETDRIG